MIRRGWTTSEMFFAGLCGVAIFSLATAHVCGLADALVRAAGCLALGRIAAGYAASRAGAKSRGEG